LREPETHLRVDIRMELLGTAPESQLDLLLSGAHLKAQDIIVVAFPA